MQCSKCGKDTEYRSGVSKKTGKSWEGYKCVSCGNMDFIDKPRTPAAPKEKEFANLTLLELAVQLSCAEYDSKLAIGDLVAKNYKELKVFMEHADKPAGETPEF